MGMETDDHQSGHDSLPPTVVAGRPSIVVAAPSSEAFKMAHDSLVTVRLSEPDSIIIDTTATTLDARSSQLAPAKEEVDAVTPGKEADKMNDIECLDVATPTPRDSIRTMSESPLDRNLQDELRELGTDIEEGNSSDDQEEVDWEQLEKTEDEQVKDDETDNSTALLLARLEQENAKLATNPKSVRVQVADQTTTERSAVSKPRPPSMAQLRQMVNGPTPPALRYSMLPPPPMTDLEFYAALVKDYKQTAARLPTLLSNKIRKGIPPPLRGVVWQSMSGARDAALEEQYDRLCGESSPYEVIIGKDLGRSFPGVDMFRDPEGDGQRMLGRVLKCFSLYDTKIGYCQGLAFLVGPLLMHMPDKQAFCVLVRLMERYDLRACFLPDLSGLHVRIYQFRELLRQILPELSSHLEDLSVDPAYCSQWFLSFFAVTCPLPMLFRIYDVIFAEGASETVMRVALSLMRKNEARLLASTELEDVMQLLLSRGLWDCYHYNADEFVQDFVGLTSVVSRESLEQLEQSYKDSKATPTSQGRSSDITTAATRFLGRIWASSPKAANTNPSLSVSPQPSGMLRRSASKQSIASTLDSIEGGPRSVTSSASTEATTVSRDSANTEDGSMTREATPVGNKTNTLYKNSDERHLHSQIEDLLTALSELQRNHALLSNQLQREREERQEDRKAVQSLLDGLKKKARPNSTPPSTIGSKSLDAELSNLTGLHEDVLTVTIEDDESSVASDDDRMESDEETIASPPGDELSELVERVERRFQSDNDRRRSSMVQTKAQLRDELLQAKDQLASVLSQSQDLGRQVNELTQEMASVKEQLRESHAHVRTLHQDKQRLERQIHNMRVRASACSTQESTRDTDSDSNSGKLGAGGLREFKLGRAKSTPVQQGQTPTFAKRISSLPQQDSAIPSGAVTPASEANVDNEALLSELVQAKTAEAMAKQEVEELRQKLEALRKANARLPGHKQANSIAGETVVKPAAVTSGSPASGGGFWGWRRG